MLAHQVTSMESTDKVKSALSNWVETRLAWKQLAKALNKSTTDLSGNIKRRIDAKRKEKSESEKKEATAVVRRRQDEERLAAEQKARVRINTDIFKLKVEADMVAPVHEFEDAVHPLRLPYQEHVVAVGGVQLQGHVLVCEAPGERLKLVAEGVLQELWRRDRWLNVSQGDVESSALVQELFPFGDRTSEPRQS